MIIRTRVVYLWVLGAAVIGLSFVVLWATGTISLVKRVAPLGLPGYVSGFYRPSFDPTVQVFKFEYGEIQVPRNFVWHIYEEGGFIKGLHLHAAFSDFSPVTKNNSEKFKFAATSKSKINIEIKPLGWNSDPAKDYDQYMLQTHLDRYTDVNKKPLPNGLTVFQPMDPRIKIQTTTYVHDFRDGGKFVADCRQNLVNKIRFCSGLIYSYRPFLVEYEFLESQLDHFRHIYRNVSRLMTEFFYRPGNAGKHINYAQ